MKRFKRAWNEINIRKGTNEDSRCLNIRKPKNPQKR